MYAYLSKDGLYVDSNLNLILIKMEADKVAVDELILVKKDSIIYDNLSIDKDWILISPKYHTCINSTMKLVKITPDYMDCTFVDYIKNNTDVNTQHMVLNMIGRINTTNKIPVDVVGTVNPLPKHNSKKSREIKDTINSISNIFMMDIVDLLFANGPDSDIDLSNYLNYHQVKPYVIRQHIKDYFKQFGFHLFQDTLLEHVLIIKDLDNSFNGKTNRPLTIYSHTNTLGLVIGTKGANIKILKDKLNELNDNWVVPYITVKNIEERPTNTDIDDAVRIYLKIVTNMLKVRFMLGVKHD